MVKLAYLARLLKSSLQMSPSVTWPSVARRGGPLRVPQITHHYSSSAAFIRLLRSDYNVSRIKIWRMLINTKCTCKGSVIRCSYPQNIQIQIPGINLETLKKISPQVLSALDILQPPHIDYFEEMYPLPFTDSEMDSGIPVLICCTITLNLKLQLLLLVGVRKRIVTTHKMSISEAVSSWVWKFSLDVGKSSLKKQILTQRPSAKLLYTSDCHDDHVWSNVVSS